MSADDPETPRPADAEGEAPVTADSDDDAARPLYRDEATSTGSDSGSPTPSSGSAEDTDSDAASDPTAPTESTDSTTTRPRSELSDETTILSRARAHKRSQIERDPDETTLLPRTAGGGRVRRRPDDDADFEDDIEADPKADRRRLLLMIGAVAVVAVLGLLAGYAIIKTTSQPVAGPGTATSAQPDPDAPSTGDASNPANTALITDQMLLTDTDSATLDSKRTWKVALTQRGSSPDSPHHPACLSDDVTSGAPTPQQSVLRLLSSTGSNSPAVLQQATAYGTPEEAAQAYAYAARALGDCAMTGAWVTAGHLISGVGDQAAAVTIEVVGGDTPEYRTVVLTRTGLVVDVIDVAQPDKAISATRVAKVAGAVVDTQCQAASGACSDQPEAQDGPPPLGGDNPGFLASGDLPPMGTELTRWAGTTPGEPDSDVLLGSGCEIVNWSKVQAEDRSHRTYLLADSASRFGLDQVIITAKNEQAASALATKVKDGWTSCHDRKLTATITPIRDVSGPGAKSVDVKGWTTEVTQKSSDSATTKYRVGIVTAGTKVVFLFLNPQDTLDLTSDQFDTVAVRAGQRTTQVN
ncbi:MAG: hypothetical protein QM650_14520 [Microlunatus sp.]